LEDMARVLLAQNQIAVMITDCKKKEAAEADLSSESETDSVVNLGQTVTSFNVINSKMVIHFVLTVVVAIFMFNINCTENVDDYQLSEEYLDNQTEIDLPYLVKSNPFEEQLEAEQKGTFQRLYDSWNGFVNTAEVLHANGIMGTLAWQNMNEVEYDNISPDIDVTDKEKELKKKSDYLSLYIMQFMHKCVYGDISETDDLKQLLLICNSGGSTLSHKIMLHYEETFGAKLTKLDGLSTAFAVFGMIIDTDNDFKNDISKKFDLDNEKEITYNDFSSTIASFVGSNTDDDSLQTLFEIFDIDQDGYLELQDMARVALGNNFNGLDVRLPSLNTQTSNSKSYISELIQPFIQTISIPTNGNKSDLEQEEEKSVPTTPIDHPPRPKLQDDASHDSLSSESHDSMFSEYSRRKGCDDIIYCDSILSKMSWNGIPLTNSIINSGDDFNKFKQAFNIYNKYIDRDNYYPINISSDAWNLIEGLMGRLREYNDKNDIIIAYKKNTDDRNENKDDDKREITPPPQDKSNNNDVPPMTVVSSISTKHNHADIPINSMDDELNSLPKFKEAENIQTIEQFDNILLSIFDCSLPDAFHIVRHVLYNMVQYQNRYKLNKVIEQKL